MCDCSCLNIPHPSHNLIGKRKLVGDDSPAETAGPGQDDLVVAGVVDHKTVSYFLTGRDRPKFSKTAETVRN